MSKVRKTELSFLYATCRLVLFYISHFSCCSACTNCLNQDIPELLAPISGSPSDQPFSLTFRNSASIFLNSHLWSKPAILKLNNTNKQYFKSRKNIFFLIAKFTFEIFQ